MSERDNAGMQRTLRDNIDRLTARQKAERANASFGERLAARIAAFAGSMTFVAVHLVAYAGWIAVNLRLLPIVRPPDPSLVLLATEASVEAIFLSTFVLISQNRFARDADCRADLDLHINLLAEHELTKLAQLVERIARRLDVPVDDDKFEEITKDVAPTQVLDAIVEKTPTN